MLLKILSVPALVAMGTLPCQAHHLVFSVQNLSKVPWDLVDETETMPGDGYRLGLLSPESGPANPRILGGMARFTVEPRATLTFFAETGSQWMTRLTLNLQSGPGSVQLPAPGAGLQLPVLHGSWIEACGPGWVPLEANAFVINDDGLMTVRHVKPIKRRASRKKPDPEPAKALPDTRPTRYAKRVRIDEQKAEPSHDLSLPGLVSLTNVHASGPAASAGPLPPGGQMPPDEPKTERSLFAPLTPLVSPMAAPREDPAGGGRPVLLLTPFPEEHKTGAGLDAAPAISSLEALREDLAGSAMFLGNDEGQILAASLGLTLDVHIPIGEWKDGEGRVVIGVRSRFGAPGPLAARRDGLILLNMGRHYTVLRPASPAEIGSFVLEVDGTPYQEVTQTVAAPGGGLRQAPMIPSDGHCLIGALHYLHFGSPASADQVGAHRRLVAGRMSDEALNTLATELTSEVLAGVYLVLPNGCFPTLGPAFSRSLQADTRFREAFNRTVNLQQEKQMALLELSKLREAGEPAL